MGLLDVEGMAEETVAVDGAEDAGEDVVGSMDLAEAEAGTTMGETATRVGEIEVVEAWADLLPADARPPLAVADRPPAHPRAAPPGRRRPRVGTGPHPGGGPHPHSVRNAARPLLAVASPHHRAEGRRRSRATVIRGRRRPSAG